MQKKQNDGGMGGLVANNEGGDGSIANQSADVRSKRSKYSNHNSSKIKTPAEDSIQDEDAE